MDDHIDQSQEQVREVGPSSREDALTSLDMLGGPELEYFALARLERFAALLAEPQVREVPSWHRLTRHAVAAAYRDCLALGLKDEASVVIEVAFAERV
jgi:hypothetical protein